MGKYPVTNRQYARFLTPANFSDESLWVDLPDLDANGQQVGTLGEEAWRWLQEKMKDEDVLTPRYWHDGRFGVARPAAPVVGVSWYEAMAYGRWVQRNWGRLAEAEQNPVRRPQTIRLPVEGEWEKAVGGTAHDRYAWDKPGEVSDREKLITCANTRESGIYRTTPVWTYPQGQSHPYGLWDVSGNVWKWQANRDEPDARGRVVRGGSFGYDRCDARCAFRFWSNPVDGNDICGFRLCLRP
jgi:formylglycine-generating enzyme required for sulfatase activity